MTTFMGGYKHLFISLKLKNVHFLPDITNCWNVDSCFFRSNVMCFYLL